MLHEILFKDSTLLYVSRMEPSGKLNVLSSSSFFERQIDTRVVFTGANQFEMKDGFLFAVTEQEVKEEGVAERQLHVARPGERSLLVSCLNENICQTFLSSGLLLRISLWARISWTSMWLK